MIYVRSSAVSIGDIRALIEERRYLLLASWSGLPARPVALLYVGEIDRFPVDNESLRLIDEMGIVELYDGGGFNKGVTSDRQDCRRVSKL
jgi:hypothetical protein